jgi:hypothetical protein
MAPSWKSARLSLVIRLDTLSSVVRVSPFRSRLRTRASEEIGTSSNPWRAREGCEEAASEAG